MTEVTLKTTLQELDASMVEKLKSLFHAGEFIQKTEEDLCIDDN